VVTLTKILLHFGRWAFGALCICFVSLAILGFGERDFVMVNGVTPGLLRREEMWLKTTLVLAAILGYGLCRLVEAVIKDIDKK